MKTAALVGRRGDDGGRYVLPGQWRQMRVAAWRMHRAGDMVQVWRAMPNGDLLSYDGDATRRITDYIVKARAALAPVPSAIAQGAREAAADYDPTCIMCRDGSEPGHEH